MKVTIKIFGLIVKRLVSIGNLADLRVAFIILTLDLLEEALVLIDSLLLLLDSLLLIRENLQLILLALDLSVTLLVLLLQFRDVLVACSHHFGIVIKEGSVLNE